MARQRNQLTVSQLRGNLAPGTYGDRDGLALRVTPRGGRQWVQKVTLAGRQISLGLGSFPTVSLGDARDRAVENRRLAKSGTDPRQDKSMEEEAAEIIAVAPSSTPTLRDLAADVIAFKSQSWKSERHGTQWEESLRLHVYPRIGDKPVDEITRADVMDVLTPIWHEKAETSRRLLQRLSTVMDWALVKGFRADNPCYKLDMVLGKHQQQKQPHKSLPYAEVPEALKAVQKGRSAVEVKLAFTFLLLTAGRTAEVLGARWSEIDCGKNTWTVPAERMKNNRPHTVPLSTPALAILELARELQGYKGIKEKWEYVFPSRRALGNKPLSKMAFEMAVRRLDLPTTVHGFRASFATWADEVHEAREVVVESALSHTRRQRESLGYDRATHLEDRRALMQAWADFVYPSGG